MTTPTTKNPQDYTAGLGELVRAHRKYTGLSQRTFAEQCGIREKSLSDIEIGRRDTPPGFLDTVEQVVSRYDNEVEATIQRAGVMVEDGHDEIEFTVSTDPDDEWVRAVIGRAAVLARTIRPTLPQYMQC